MRYNMIKVRRWKWNWNSKMHHILNNILTKKSLIHTELHLIRSNKCKMTHLQDETSLVLPNPLNTVIYFVSHSTFHQKLGLVELNKKWSSTEYSNHTTARRVQQENCTYACPRIASPKSPSFITCQYYVSHPIWRYEARSTWAIKWLVHIKFPYKMKPELCRNPSAAT